MLLHEVIFNHYLSYRLFIVYLSFNCFVIQFLIYFIVYFTIYKFFYLCLGKSELVVSCNTSHSSSSSDCKTLHSYHYSFYIPLFTPFSFLQLHYPTHLFYFVSINFASVTSSIPWLNFSLWYTVLHIYTFYVIFLSYLLSLSLTIISPYLNSPPSFPIYPPSLW